MWWYLCGRGPDGVPKRVPFRSKTLVCTTFGVCTTLKVCTQQALVVYTVSISRSPLVRYPECTLLGSIWDPIWRVVSEGMLPV
jgi:hypothetical protein